MSDSPLTTTTDLNRMKEAMPGAAMLMHSLLGCQFGHPDGILHREQEPTLCQEAAVQIVVLHDGPREMVFKLCAPHRDLVLSETTPRAVPGA